MLYRLAIPQEDQEIEEVRVLEWHKKEGESIVSGDLLIELETDKSVIEIRPSKGGILRCILVPDGDWNKIGKALAVISDSTEEAIPDDVDTLPYFDVDFDMT